MKEKTVKADPRKEERVPEREMGPYLIDWFSCNARILPWREQPEPYYVWISEIMLQQTRVEAVKGYFERFITALPDIRALSQVPEEKLLKLWEGLGYYNRARNLKKAALVVMREYDGRLPEKKEELLKLPGIGAYTAGAIASIAYGRRAAAVDGNVLRVMMRLRGSFEDITKETVKKELARTLEEVMPKDQPGTFNQALMELGAIVCLPNGRPLCEKCPVMHLCRAFHCGTQMQIPVKAKKKPRRIEEKTILVIETEEGILVRKRPEKGLVAGLWEYPALEGKHSYEAVEQLLMQAGFQLKELSRMKDAKHIFSHIEWHMTGFYASVKQEKGNGPGGEDMGGRKGILAEKAAAYGAQTEEAGSGERFLAGCLPVGRKQLEEEYSMPSALEAYRIPPV